MRSAPVELCDCRDRGGRVLVELFARDQQNLDALGVLSLLATPRHRLGDVSTLLSGLIGPGDRKSIQPMAKRLGVWDAAPVETELLVQADRLVGGNDAVLVIDDTAIPKKGTHSVGVAAQYASALGKTAGSGHQDRRHL